MPRDRRDLFNTNPPETDQQWVSGPQTIVHPVSSQISSWFKFGAGVTATALLSRHRFASGKRGVDYLLGGVRAVEEYSPGRIFRTFQVGHMLSVFEQESLQTRFFSPEIIRGIRKTEAGQAWLEHAGRLIGRPVTSPDILQTGFRYEGGQLLTGQVGGNVLLKHAGVIRSPAGAQPALQLGYARSLAGGPLANLPTGLTPEIAELEVNFGRRALTQQVPYITAAGEKKAEILFLTGGQTRLQAAQRALFGYGTTLGERINQLARAPFEIEPFASIMKKAPILRRIGLGVVPSSGLKTVGKIALKLGIGGTAAYYSWRYIDRAMRRSELLDDTIFDEGLTAGIATAWTKLSLATSSLAEWTGGHRLREWQEGIAPGSTSVSRLLAFPIMGALGGLGISYAERVARQYGYKRAGLSAGQASIAASLRGVAVREALYQRAIPSTMLTGIEEKTLNLVREGAGKFLEGTEGRVLKRIATAQTGRGITGRMLSLLGELTPARGRMWLGGLLGAALIAPFIPGALVPEKKPEELQRLYSGQQYVPVMKGRWWEMGRSPWGGTRPDYWRQHWYPRLLLRAKERAIWGEDEPSPFEKWRIENTTYELEKKHYWSRPYPQSGIFGEDIPFIGPLIAGTIGKLIKPPALMHTEEWMRQREGETEYARMPLSYGERLEVPEMGETGPGAPISPYSMKGLVGEQAYRLAEMIGLPGFTMTAIKEAITGEQDLFAQEQQLESASRMYGAERDLWDLSLGGGLGSTELLRRLYPHRRRCLLPKSVVLLSDGRSIEIENVDIGSYTFTHQGRERRITDKMSRYIDEEIIQLKTRYHNQCLSLTQDHLVRCIRTHHCTVRGSKACVPCLKRLSTCNKRRCKQDFFVSYQPEWIPAGELSLTDFVFVPYGLQHGIEGQEKILSVTQYINRDFTKEGGFLVSLTPTQGKCNSVRLKKSWTAIKPKINIDYDFGVYLGLFLAEGSFDQNSIVFNFASHEESYRQFVRKFTDKICKNRFDKEVCSIKDYSHRGVITIRVNSCLVKDLLFGLVGGLSHTKKIHPDLLMYTNREFLFGIVVGFTKGDGCVHIDKNKNLSVSQCTTSRDLAYQLRNIAAYLGYNFSVCGRSKRRSFVNQKKDSKYVYELKRSGSQVIKLAEDVAKRSLVDLKKVSRSCSRRIIAACDGIYVRVEKIEKQHYSGLVYNLEVEEDNSFTTNVCVVHNSIPLYNPIRNQMPCLAPETEVLMSDGRCKPAIDLVVGDQVVSKDGQIVFIEATKHIPADRHIKIYLYGDNLHHLSFSYNHPIYLGNDQFKIAEEILPGDFVAFPIVELNRDDQTLIDLGQFISDQKCGISDKYLYYGNQKENFREKEIAEQYDFNVKDIPIALKRDYPKLYSICRYYSKSIRLRQDQRIQRWWQLDDFFYLVGVYAAEGSWGNKGRSFKLAGHQQDKWEKRIDSIFAKYGVKSSKNLATEGTGQNVICSNPLLAEMLTFLCPGHARTKYLHKQLLNYSFTANLELIKGLIDGDGYYCKTAEGRIKCGLRTTSKDLAYQFRNLVINTLEMAPAITVGLYNSKTSIHVALSGLMANQLADKVGYKIFDYLPKQDNNKQYVKDNHIYLKVKRVETEIKDCFVIGHQVSGDHTYCVSLFATHNTWLPGPGEKSEDFWHGDVMSRIPEGELRLPGRGYEIIHPELEGVAPGDYPLKHRYAILADLAPYTDQYRHALGQVRGEIARGKFTKGEVAWIREIQSQVQQKKRRKEFSDYQWDEGTPTPFQKILPQKKPTSTTQNGTFERLLGSYWEQLSHHAETPLEYLTPVSPASKLVHMRTAVEDYERTQVHGSSNAFWQHPIRDFFGPFWDNLKHTMGFEGIPDHVKRQRSIEEYFDILKYVKHTRLKNAAVADGDRKMIKENEGKRRETLFGINPFSYNFSHIYRSLPRRERDYFREFSETTDMEERMRIYKQVPENEQALYLAHWKLKDAQDIRAAVDAGLLTEKQEVEADKALDELREERKAEGMPTSDTLWVEYLGTRLEGESYPDWYRRKYLLVQKLAGRPLPGPDWVGFNPAVSLEDIKLKIIENEGESMYDYDIWPQQMRSAAGRPYLEEAAGALEGQMSNDELRSRIEQLFSQYNVSNTHILVENIGDSDSVDMTFQEDRTEDVRQMMRRGGLIG